MGDQGTALDPSRMKKTEVFMYLISIHSVQVFSKTRLVTDFAIFQNLFWNNIIYLYD